MQLIKIENDRYAPAYNADREASAKIKVGDEVHAMQSRNAEFHRKGMALLRLGYENQDKFDDFEIYRQILTMKAGFVHWTKDKDGKDFPLPKSISFEKMNSEEFQKWYEAIRTIISKEAKISGTLIDAELENFF